VYNPFIEIHRGLFMTAKEVIEFYGGTAKTAKLCGVTMQTVSNWKKRGVPKSWLRFLESTQALSKRSS
jgi:hypothetical protein